MLDIDSGRIVWMRTGQRESKAKCEFTGLIVSSADCGITLKHASTRQGLFARSVRRCKTLCDGC